MKAVLSGPNRRWRLTLLALILFDLCHRLVSLSAGPFPLYRDTLSYWRIGEAIAAGRGLVAGDPTAFRVPIYPAFLAANQRIFGDWGLEAAVVTQNVLGFATSLMIGWLCVSWSRRVAVGVAGYGLAVLGVGRVQYDAMLMSESLFIFLLTAHQCVLWAAITRRSRMLGLASGLLAASAALTRPVAALLVVAELAAVAVAAPLRLPKWPRGLVASLVVGTLLPLAAWMLRNEVLFGSPSLFRSAGISEWEHTFRQKGAGLSLPEGEAGSLPDSVSDWRNGWSVAAALQREGGEQLSAAAMRAIAERARREQRRSYLAALARNALRFWYDTEEAIPYHPRATATALADYQGQRVWSAPVLLACLEPALIFAYRYPWWLQFGLSIWAWIGALILSTRSGMQRLQGVLLAAWLSYFWFATVLTMYPLYRFRMVLQPAMIVSIAVACGVLLFEGRCTRNLKPSLASAVASSWLRWRKRGPYQLR